MPGEPPGRSTDLHRVTNPDMTHPVVLGFPWITKLCGHYFFRRYFAVMSSCHFPSSPGMCDVSTRVAH